MATCRAQTSLQPPLAIPDTSSQCPLGLLLFLKVYNSRDESYFKATTATSKHREATSRGAWEFLISRLPACGHYIIKCYILLQFYAVLESAQKIRTFESERDNIGARYRPRRARIIITSMKNIFQKCRGM